MKINYLSRAIRAALGLGAVSLTFGMIPITAAQADFAGSVQWTGNNSGDWTDAGNWITAPYAGSDVLVTDSALTGSGATNVIYTNPGGSNPGSAVLPLNSVVVDGSLANSMTLNQSTDNLSTNQLTAGDSGYGTVNLTGGTQNVSGNLILGNQATGNGSYTITGDTTQTNVNFLSGGNGGNPNGALIVGESGTGTFTQGMVNQSDTGNQVNVAGDLALGHQSGSQGTYTLNTGTLNVGGQAAVGGLTGSNGTFTQNGGILNLTNSANQPTVNPDYTSVGSGAFGGKLAIGGGITSSGGNDGGSGTYNLTGGTVNATANGIEVGPTGTGTMNQSGGTVNTTFLTEGFSGTGTYNLSGTGTINSYSENVGYAGTGTFNQSGGMHTIATDLRVGAQYGPNSPGNGTYNLSGGVLNSGNTYLGQGETGSIVVTDSLAISTTHNVSGNLVIGTLGLPDGVNPQPAGNGSYSITGSSSQLNVDFVPGGNGNNGATPPTPNPNGALIVGSDNGSTGTFTQGTSGGTDTPSVNVAGDLVLGLNQGSQGTYTLNSGNLNVGGAMVVGSASTNDNQFIQNGGTVTLTSSASGNSDYVQGSNAWSPIIGTLAIGGEEPFDNGTGTYTLNNGSLSANSMSLGYSGTGTFNQNGGSVLVNGGIDMGDCGGCNGGNAAGFYNLNGNGSLTSNGISVGDFGHAEFVQGADGNGNTVNTINGTLAIGNGPTATPNTANPGNYDRSGTYTLDSGTLNAQTELVGNSGTGTLIQNGGTNNVSGYLDVGVQNSQPLSTGGTPVFGGPAPGVYTMNGGTLTVNGDPTQPQFSGVNGGVGMIIGDAGNGTFNQIGGSVTTGTAQVSGGAAGTEGDLVIGAQGPSTVVGAGPGTGQGIYNLGQTGQTSAPNLTVNGSIIIGRDAGSNGATVPGATPTNANLVIQGDGTSLSVLYNGGASNANPLSSDIMVGLNGNGAVTQQDKSSVYMDGNLSIGINQGAVGSYTLNATSLSSGTNLVVGNYLNIGGVGGFVNGVSEQTAAIGGTGTFTQNSGDVQVNGATYIGNNGGTGTYTQTGGTATFGSFNGSALVLGTSNSVNPAGQGTYSITGNSTLTVNGDTIIARDSGSAGSSMTIGSGTDTPTVNFNGYLTVGAGDQGSLAIKSGTVDVGATTYVGGSPNGVGTVTQTGGSFSTGFLDIGTVTGNGSPNNSYTVSDNGSVTVANNLVLGSGTLYGNPDGSGGTFTQSGTSQVSAGNIFVNNGTYNVNDSSTLTVNDSVYLGHTKTGADFVQSGNSHVSITNNLQVGTTAGLTGSYTLNDNASLTTGRTLVGDGSTTYGTGGIGTFTQNGGTHDTGQLLIGSASGNGTYNMNGGALNAGLVVVGDSGTGVLNQSGGTNTVTGNVTVAQQAGSTGTYNLSGGSLAAASMNVNTGGTFNYSGGSFSLASGAGTLTNDGQVNLSGGGTRIVDGNVVNNSDGTFKVTDTSVTYTGTFTNNGAYLSDPATNTFNNNFTVGTTGYLTGGLGDVFKMEANFINNSMQYALWSTAAATLEFTASTTTHDMTTTGNFGQFDWGSLILDSGASLDLTGNLTVGLFDLVGGLSDLSALTGNFDIFYNASLAGNAWLNGQNYCDGAGGCITAYIPSSPVPEPGLFLLMGAGLGGMFFGVRRRKA